jgi:zeaxanthin glucosyltransferase
MRIAFVTLPLPSHTYALTALARGLQKRGHEIVFIGLLDQARMVQDAGFQFVSFAESEFPAGEASQQFHALGAKVGTEGILHTMQLLARIGKAALKDGGRALVESGADAAVLDFVLRGFDAVAIACNLPYVHVSAALHSDYSGHTPMIFYDWAYDESPEALARNRAALRAFSQLTSPLRASIQAYLEEAGVRLDWGDPYALLSRRAWVTQIPRAFDFPGTHWPSQFQHTGPFIDSYVRPDVEFPWKRLTDCPLVYASMGTIQNGSADLYRMIVDAAHKPGRQLVLSLGNNLHPDELGPVPENVVVVRYAPQLELLKRAALCITHGGPNTVLEALTCGVPLVAIPITNDQPGTAARIAHTHTGLFMRLGDASVEHLRSLVDEVLTDSAYTAAAKRMSNAIAEADGLSRAIEIIDGALKR